MNKIASNPTHESLPFQPLGNARRLDFLPQACLGLRFGRQVCVRCETDCPVQAIQLDENALALNEHCLGCGRCAAVCPAGALRAKGFAEQTAALMQAVTVDCWKVPQQYGAADSLRIPCLGGLSKSALLALLVGSQGQPVRLLDRGWCSGCTAGGGKDHPAAVVVEEVSQILANLGLPLEERPQLMHVPLPSRLMPAEIPAPLTQHALSRRSFFRAMLSETADTVARVTAQHEKVTATARGIDHMHPAGQASSRVAALIMQLAARTSRPLSAAWFPSVELGQACCNHGICAAACPGGALSRYADIDANGIQFDPTLCIACGLCETVCPEHAVRLLPQGNSTHPVQCVELNRFTQTACSVCGKKFNKTPQMPICAACTKQRQIGKSLFGTLYASDQI